MGLRIMGMWGVEGSLRGEGVLWVGLTALLVAFGAGL